ncbi:hypothetical protein P8C59_007532 [Phyllachora maydis]|uniref:Uncharacterized protein n=1 Tax=Phyllachora maydis TaxID=1825666 RepID=A0AAD9IAF7_9PEZI|nr:hypothetical protein P8C59_007532 [Phyllachora maydis]
MAPWPKAGLVGKGFSYCWPASSNPATNKAQGPDRSHMAGRCRETRSTFRNGNQKKKDSTDVAYIPKTPDQTQVKIAP